MSHGPDDDDDNPLETSWDEHVWVMKQRGTPVLREPPSYFVILLVISLLTLIALGLSALVTRFLDP
jgi:hypothetical protein